MTIFLLIIIVLLLTALIYTMYKIYSLAKIIMIFEDDLSNTIEALNECEESLNNVISLRLFFENESVRPILETAKQEVSMCRMKVRQMATRFVERSKQQYVIYEEPIEIEKVRDIPGAINDELITNNILGFKQSLGDEADVVFATQQEMEAYMKMKSRQGFNR